MSATDLIDLSAAQATRRIAARELSADELFEAYRARAAADELNLRFYLGCSRAFGRTASGELPGPRARAGSGVPLAVKDLFCTEGVPSQSGSRILEGYEPPYTATVVRKLQAAGASLQGKTNQDEFAMGSSNENSAFGPVLNPWDRTRVLERLLRAGAPPRSRRGSRHGRLAPTREARFASPLRCAGSSASKPTYGSVSRYGMIAFASSLDQAGPG